MTKNQIFAVILSVITVVLLYFAPTSTSNLEEQIVEIPEKSVEAALELIRGGGAPMPGILMLKSIAEEDPDNLEAQHHLGVLSLQSGQLDKGIGRFEYILEREPENLEAFYYLGRLLVGKNENERALEYFEKYMAAADDENRKTEVKKYINELKN